jgi:hypothetical protein
MKRPSDHRRPSGSNALTIAVIIVVAVVLAGIAYRTLIQLAPLELRSWLPA